MRRREFITGLGSAAAWPLAARAQQAVRVRRVGVLMLRDQDDPMERARLAVFEQSLMALGWTEGRNLRLDVRWAAQNAERTRTFAHELVDLKPDAIFVTGGVSVLAIQRETQTIPIVFAQAGDAVANGLVRNIARPEGNTTGISNNVPSFGGKWLDLLKDVAPAIARVALIFNPEIALGSPYFASIEAAAQQFGINSARIPVRNAFELEHAIETFATEPNGGLIDMPPPLRSDERQLMYRLALKHRLPAIYSTRTDAVEGGLMSYAPDTTVLIRLAGSYVDRILRGAKPGELPVQFPTKYELVINLKTAKAMGLTIPESFLLRADEVIE
jgi:putative tryptophan/tyrosine transport system substrate-binding protein